ncbi:hypothetical protein Q7P35_005209 [Cladosporium inversicolor]
MHQHFSFAHGCTDTLCRLRCEIINRGPDEAWRRLPDFVMDISNFTQNSQYLHKYNHFMIHEIFRPHGVTSPVDFVVIFGRAALRLGSFASTKIGSAAIRDLFTSPYFPQLTKESIEQGIEVWRDRADRTTDAQEGQGNMYEVSPSPVGRRVRWNSGIECDYTFDSLVRTEAGRVVLGLSISGVPLEGGRRSVFEVEEVEGESGERLTGRWWNVIGFMSLCWRSEE